VIVCDFMWRQIKVKSFAQSLYNFLRGCVRLVYVVRMGRRWTVGGFGICDKAMNVTLRKVLWGSKMSPILFVFSSCFYLSNSNKNEGWKLRQKLIAMWLVKRAWQQRNTEGRECGKERCIIRPIREIKKISWKFLTARQLSFNTSPAKSNRGSCLPRKWAI